MADSPLCREVVQHLPIESPGNTSSLNLCCVKVICATLDNKKTSIGSSQGSSLPSLSFGDYDDLIHAVSEAGGIHNADSNRDAPLDHGSEEFDQPLLHIPDGSLPLDFGDYEHEQPEFHIPEKLSLQRDDKKGAIPLSTSTAPNVPQSHTESAGLNLQVLQVTQNSVQVRFPGITGGNLMYVEERLYRQRGKAAGNFAHHSSVHLDHAHIHTPWENAIILEGNKIYTLTALKSGTLYRLRWQAPDKQYPDIMVSTQGIDYSFLSYITEPKIKSNCFYITRLTFHLYICSSR